MQALKYVAPAFILVLATCFGAQFATGQPVSPRSPSLPAPFVAQSLGRTTVPVDGTWQFREGDNMAWAAPGLDDSSWQPIQVGRPWEGQGHRNLTGFAWYRR